MSRVVLNDLDPALHAFWRALLMNTDELCRLIQITPVTMTTWKKQRRIIENPSAHSTLSLAYAAFFLNRTNRSGIIRGGVIGGQHQKSKWRLDARFNTRDLIHRIRRIAQLRDSITIYKMEATVFLRRVGAFLPRKSLVFLDPPYFNRGRDLYWNTYTAIHHRKLFATVSTALHCPWIVSYDDAPPVKRLYRGYAFRPYHLSYSAARRYIGSEILFFSKELTIPRRGLPMIDILDKRPVK